MKIEIRVFDNEEGTYSYGVEDISCQHDDRFTVEMAVGIKDAKINMIYEGDIVEVWNVENWKKPTFKGKGVVIYDDEDCTFKIKGNLFMSFIDLFNYNKYDIVGNICEEKWLIQSQKKKE